MLTDEQLCNELVGVCPRCGQNVELCWVYDRKRKPSNYRICRRHKQPFWMSGTRRWVTCGGTGLQPKEA